MNPATPVTSQVFPMLDCMLFFEGESGPEGPESGDDSPVEH
jgi:hypothetical protein